MVDVELMLFSRESQANVSLCKREKIPLFFQRNTEKEIWKTPFLF